MIPKFRAWVKPEILSNHMNGVIAEAKPDFIERVCLVKRNDLKSDECFDEIFDFDDVILMQSTGLKDKNGVEIYEGDIVRRARPCKSEDEIMHIGFANGSFYTTFFPDWCRTSLFSYIEFGNQVEVIGNIYEQPELLTSGIK